ERQHLRFVMAPERHRAYRERERDRPTTHTTPSGASDCGTGPRDKRRAITNPTSNCQWDGAALAASFVDSFLGNHFGISACSRRICESTFHAPSSLTRV